MGDVRFCEECKKTQDIDEKGRDTVKVLTPQDLMDTQEVATLMRVTRKHVQNNWPRVLPGVRPQKTVANQKKLLFLRSDIQALLSQPK